MGQENTEYQANTGDLVTIRTRLRTLMQHVGEWLHASLILAGVVPALYMVSSVREDKYLVLLFFAGLLIMTPIAALFRLLTGHLRSLLLILAIGLAVCAGVFRGTEGIGRMAAPDGSGILIQILFAAEVLFLLADACSIQLQENRRYRARMENDISYQESSRLFEKPQAVFLAWFVILYLSGLMMKCSVMCDLALWSGTVYFLLFCIYRSSTAFEEYLLDHSGVTHIPVRRMQRVGRAVLALFLLIAAAGLVPALLSSPLRRFIDLREIEFPAMDLFPMQEFESAPPDMDPLLLQELMEAEQKEPPIIFEILFHVLSILSMVLVVWLIYKAIRQVFRTFRDRPEENGDIITTLEPEEEITREKRPGFWFRESESRREQIRRQYRAMIRKYRKEKPGPFETPKEIEENAGISDLEEVRSLHELYEEVRYGKEGS